MAGYQRGERPAVMSAAPAVVSIEHEPARFAAIRDSATFGEIEAHPQTGAYARSYYPAVHGEACRDVSFAIIVANQPASVVLCTLLAGKLCLYGLPVRVFFAQGIDRATLGLAARTAMTELDRLLAQKSASHIVIRDTSSPALTLLGETCLSRNATAAVKVVAEVDLTLGEEGWRRSLRKSFKSLLNWGRQELVVTAASTLSELSVDFKRFRAFHQEVAGRSTRPLASWDAMQAWVATGRGELLMGSLGEKLVSANLFIDGNETSIYMTGVYDRSLFDKPLAHYPLWLGFQHAKSRGMKRAELGDIHFKGTISEKEFAIGYFKRGFATGFATHLEWSWQLFPQNEEVKT
jgi:Acetyltransferase (GNAT) domain